MFGIVLYWFVTLMENSLSVCILVDIYMVCRVELRSKPCSSHNWSTGFRVGFQEEYLIGFVIVYIWSATRNTCDKSVTLYNHSISIKQKFIYQQQIKFLIRIKKKCIFNLRDLTFRNKNHRFYVLSIQIAYFRIIFSACSV